MPEVAQARNEIALLRHIEPRQRLEHAGAAESLACLASQPRTID